MFENNDFDFLDTLASTEEFERKENNSSQEPQLWDVRWVGLSEEIVGKSLDIALIKGTVKGRTNFYRKVEYYPMRGLFKPDNTTQYIESKFKVERNRYSDDFYDLNIKNNPAIPESRMYLFNPKVVYYLFGINLGNDPINKDFKFEKDKLIVYVFQDRLFSDIMSKLRTFSREKLEDIFTGKSFIRITFSSFVSKRGKTYVSLGDVEVIERDIRELYESTLQLLETGSISTKGDKIPAWDNNFESLYMTPEVLKLTEEKEDSIIKYLKAEFEGIHFSEIKEKEPVKATPVTETPFNSFDTLMSDDTHECVLEENYKSGKLTEEQYNSLGKPKFGNHPSGQCARCNLCPFESECVGL